MDRRELGWIPQFPGRRGAETGAHSPTCFVFKWWPDISVLGFRTEWHSVIHHSFVLLPASLFYRMFPSSYWVIEFSEGILPNMLSVKGQTGPVKYRYLRGWCFMLRITFLNFEGKKFQCMKFGLIYNCVQNSSPHHPLFQTLVRWLQYCTYANVT